MIYVVAHGWDGEPWRRRLKAHFPDREVAVWPEPVYPDQISHAVVWKPPKGLLATFPRLSAIHSLGAGVDGVLNDPDLPAAPLYRVIDPDLTTRMSEWVVLQVLFHHRQMPFYLANQARAQWRDLRDQPAARDVRVGIMGLGELGMDAVRTLAPLGFDLAGWSRRRKDVPGLVTYAGEEELGAFLGRTDILVCLLPLTPDTRGILSRGLFSRLARDGRLGGPVVLNAGRGGLQNEADILAALQDGTLKGASLDVFETEPLPPESPLWRVPGLVITPHNAAMSEPEAVSAYIAENIRRIEAGEEPRGYVDRSVGY